MAGGACRQALPGDRYPADRYPADRYPPTVPPSGLTGQQEDTGQVRQPGLTPAR